LLYEAANGFRSTWQIRLLAAPIVKRRKELLRHPHLKRAARSAWRSPNFFSLFHNFGIDRHDEQAYNTIIEANARGKAEIMSLDKTQLKSVTINGLDAILLLMNLTIEIVSAVSPTDKDAEQHLTDIANRLDGFARELPESRMKFLMGQLAIAIIASERTI
jgi:hypothetical protein